MHVTCYEALPYLADSKVGRSFRDPQFAKFSLSDWAGRHTVVSEEEFKRGPFLKTSRLRARPSLGRTARQSVHRNKTRVSIARRAKVLRDNP